MADRGNERDGARGGRARDDLLVEAPKIFERTAAARDDQHIGSRDGSIRLKRVEPGDRGGDLRGAGLALNTHWPDQHAARETIVQTMQNVSDHRAGRRSDHADHLR